MAILWATNTPCVQNKFATYSAYELTIGFASLTKIHLPFPLPDDLPSPTTFHRTVQVVRNPSVIILTASLSLSSLNTSLIISSWLWSSLQASAVPSFCNTDWKFQLYVQGSRCLRATANKVIASNAAKPWPAVAKPDVLIPKAKSCLHNAGGYHIGS